MKQHAGNRAGKETEPGKGNRIARPPAREWAILCARFGGRCLACGATGGVLIPSFVVPIEDGGARGIGNVQPLCPACVGTARGDYRPRYNQYADALTPEKRARIDEWNAWAARINGGAPNAA